MSDDLMSPEVPSGAPMPQGSTAVKSGSRKGLFIALGALVVLAIVGGVAVALVLFVFNGVKNDVEIRVTDPTEQTNTGSASPTDAVTASGPADPVSNDEVFTFRDIFKPLVGPTATDTDTTSDETETVDTSEYAADTLYLIGISSEGDSPIARMVWNSEELSLSEGDVIAGTPWKVLEIRTSDVVMLYGDQQVVLSVGQGISK